MVTRKNDDVFDTIWDFVIVDEAHEGTTMALGDTVIKNIVKEDRDMKQNSFALLVLRPIFCVITMMNNIYLGL